MTVPAQVAKLKAEAITIEERSPFQIVMRRFCAASSGDDIAGCHGDYLHLSRSWRPILPPMKLTN